MSSTQGRMSMVLAAATTVVLTGCASSLTGVGGTERFACLAPVGAQCTSISGVYANAHRNNHLLPIHDARAVSSLLQSAGESAQGTLDASPTASPAASPIALPSALPGTLPNSLPAPSTAIAAPTTRSSASPGKLSVAATASSASATATTSIAPPSTGTSSAPASLRASPRVVRLWIAPWEDADGDLHEASFVHVVIDTGRWLIERVRPAARSRVDIAMPPVAPLSPPSPPPAPTSEAKPPANLEATEP